MFTSPLVMFTVRDLADYLSDDKDYVVANLTAAQLLASTLEKD